MTTPRKSKTLTFSLPPDMETQVRRVMKEDDLSVSELLRQAIRIFMEEREWRRRERLVRLRSRRTGQSETQATVLKVKRNEWRPSESDRTKVSDA